jgi:hypothetical protein
MEVVIAVLAGFFAAARESAERQGVCACVRGDGG